MKYGGAPCPLRGEDNSLMDEVQKTFATHPHNKDAEALQPLPWITPDLPIISWKNAHGEEMILEKGTISFCPGSTGSNGVLPYHVHDVHACATDQIIVTLPSRKLAMSALVSTRGTGQDACLPTFVMACLPNPKDRAPYEKAFKNLRIKKGALPSGFLSPLTRSNGKGRRQEARPGEPKNLAPLWPNSQRNKRAEYLRGYVDLVGKGIISPISRLAPSPDPLASAIPTTEVVTCVFEDPLQRERQHQEQQTRERQEKQQKDGRRREQEAAMNDLEKKLAPERNGYKKRGGQMVGWTTQLNGLEHPPVIFLLEPATKESLASFSTWHSALLKMGGSEATVAAQWTGQLMISDTTGQDEVENFKSSIAELLSGETMGTEPFSLFKSVRDFAASSGGPLATFASLTSPIHQAGSDTSSAAKRKKGGNEAGEVSSAPAQHASG